MFSYLSREGLKMFWDGFRLFYFLDFSIGLVLGYYSSFLIPFALIKKPIDARGTANSYFI